jgi:hypothetical protein
LQKELTVERTPLFLRVVKVIVYLLTGLMELVRELVTLPMIETLMNVK